MIALASVAILALLVLFLQYNHYQFLEKQKNFVNPEKVQKMVHELTQQVLQVRQELAHQNGRLDSIILKMGFKL